MQWADVLTNPWLQNLPFKVELNRTVTSVRVARLQSQSSSERSHG